MDDKPRTIKEKAIAALSRRRSGPSVADGGCGAPEAGVGGVCEQEAGDVGAGDAGSDLVAAEVAGADGAGAGAVGGAGEARDRPVEPAVGDELRRFQQLA